jgi:hypothetical protein
MKTVLR